MDIVAGRIVARKARCVPGSYAERPLDKRLRRAEDPGVFRACVPLVAVMLVIPQWRAGQPSSELDAALARAGSYVENFQQQLSGIVAEETYLQEIVPRGGMNGGGNRQRRRLRSDLLLVRPESAVTWTQFRDVFEVDGRPVRDRDERLTKLFLSPDASGAAQIQRIREESARYNIGRIHRTMNAPVLPLAVLALSSQPRFRFTLDHKSEEIRPRIGSGPLASSPTFTATAEGLVLNFEEREGPTLVYTTNGANIFSRGRFWIEPDTGRVLISEMITEDGRVRGELIVSYRSEPLVGLLVPVELREQYTTGFAQPTITGKATYSNFRRFQVSTDQTLVPIQ